MSRVSASSLATTVALLFGATGTMAADGSRYEVPAMAFKSSTGFHVEVVGAAVPVPVAEWRVELYSDYVYTPEEIATDTALPNVSPPKKFLQELQATPWEMQHRCGAVYIGHMWVLTAAHCVNKTLPVYLLNNWRVRVGATDLATHPGTSFKVVRVIVNGKYLGIDEKRGSDIALIKIKADSHTDSGKAAALKSIRILGDKPGDMPLAETDSLEVAGWGSTQPRDGQQTTTDKLIHGSAKLMQATVTKVPIAVCETDQEYLDLILYSAEKGKAGDPVICVKDGAGQADACQGDSGGPLTKTIGTETVLVGLVSLGKGCGSGTAAIYTNVTYFLDWIAAAKLEPAEKVSRW